MYRILVILLLLAMGQSAVVAQQVYKTVDENGNVTFTDQPPDSSAKPITISEPNLSRPPEPSVFPEEAATRDGDGGGASYEVTITSPANETIIPRGPGNFSVSATVSPALGGDHQLQLMMDGEAHEEPQRSGSWSLTNVFRGQRDITVAVVDKKGKVLSESEPVTVFVFRPSTNDANRNRPSPRPPRPTPH